MDVCVEMSDGYAMCVCVCVCWLSIVSHTAREGGKGNVYGVSVICSEEV